MLTDACVVLASTNTIRDDGLDLCGAFLAV
jgi:hypothetical protein